MVVSLAKSMLKKYSDTKQTQHMLSMGRGADVVKLIMKTTGQGNKISSPIISFEFAWLTFILKLNSAL